ncbi:hypothetical protein RPE78_12290 [Thioclava litoralis]|uniref:GpW protein n=1 Tax=Thioclava litoralis TaxID=3076557 RepID=A0ABZ1DXS7_9RHOB|nr:hypothetical protein RPE78_09585 [Thioclava sp. FTW29]WRY33446.1 hypothetical protein RPE78_12290 [Thioclava sp. FTW29]
MAYTQDQIESLKAAMAKGVTSVEMNGERVQFRSLDEMQRQLGRMQAEVAGARRVSTLRQLRPRLSRGL